MLASALPKTIEELGAIAGIVSFLLMLALLVLYVIRALEIRRLRKSMPFLVNPTNGRPPDRGSPPAPPEG
ncbi:MAG TPA: hypothetical protein VLB79_03830 [Solirubrobacterales bacterium]|nr:hypothetical protein [Solirubrobacterales bacterium]